VERLVDTTLASSATTEGDALGTALRRELPAVVSGTLTPSRGARRSPGARWTDRREEAAMSTVPGDRSWEDAGLVEPALTDLPEDARPDLVDEADAGDVAEQRARVPEDERDDYP
jgi:hypothetical protein